MCDDFEDSKLKGNELVEEMIHKFYEEQSAENLMAVCMAVRQRLNQDGHFIFPVDATTNGDGTQVFAFKTLDFEGVPVLVAFTSIAEREKAPPSDAVSQFIDVVLDAVMQNEEIAGLMLNPWGESMYLDKEDIGVILTPGSERFI